MAKGQVWQRECSRSTAKASWLPDVAAALGAELGTRAVKEIATTPLQKWITVMTTIMVMMCNRSLIENMIRHRRLSSVDDQHETFRLVVLMPPIRNLLLPKYILFRCRITLAHCIAHLIDHLGGWSILDAR